MSEETAEYDCPHCGETVVLAVDWSAGDHQQFVEDCPVCCRPNVVVVELDSHGGALLQVEPE